MIHQGSIAGKYSNTRSSISSYSNPNNISTLVTAHNLRSVQIMVVVAAVGICNALTLRVVRVVPTHPL